MVTFALWLVVAAAACHVFEEYVFPGGFLEAMRRTAPSVAFAVTVPMAVVINGLMLVGLLAAAVVGPRVPVFALSGAALGAVNGWGHVAGTLRRRRYVPGAVTGLLRAMVTRPAVTADTTYQIPQSNTVSGPAHQPAAGT